MSELLMEYKVTCPSCWQENTLILDLSEADQSYVEDCEVCCHPIQVTVHAEQGELVELQSALP